MDEFAQLKHDLARGKPDAYRQRGEEYRRYRDGWARIDWGAKCEPPPQWFRDAVIKQLESDAIAEGRRIRAEKTGAT